MKALAFTQRLVEHPDYHETRDALDLRWGALCVELNVLPVILPTAYGFTAHFDALDIAGVVLTGGNDLSSVSPSPLSRRRDTFERELLAFAVERSLPVVGVCRGMQLIGEYFGAALARVEGHAATGHPVVSAGDGEAHRERMVKSYHNYALATLPPSLQATATSPDGVIEGIEHRHLPVHGVMWHPEREDPFHPADLSFFKKVFTL